MGGTDLDRQIKELKKLYKMILCKYHKFMLTYNIEMITGILWSHLRTKHVYHSERKTDQHPSIPAQDISLLQHRYKTKSQNHLNCKNNNNKITPQSLQRKQQEDFRALHSISEHCSAHFLIAPSQTLEARTLPPKPLLVTAAAGASSG